MLEPLEDRRLLAFTDLAVIEGTLFYDLPGDVEQMIPGQPVRLYRDGNGNGVFDGAPTDPLQGTQLTNTNGYYRFDTLSAATYFVEQPPEPSGNLQPPPLRIVRTIVITPADADGNQGVTVDAFEDPQALVAQQPPAGIACVHDSMPAPTAIGGQRTLIVNAVSGSGAVRVVIDDNDNELFNYAEGPAVVGNATVIWDGTAGDHTVPNPIGLGGVDLTGDGAQDSFELTSPVTDVPAVGRLTVYTDVAHASEAVFTVPMFTTDVFRPIKFAEFTALPGLGPADFTNVGAITLQVNKDEDPRLTKFGLDYQLQAVSTVGPTLLRADLPFEVTSQIGLVKLTNGTDNDAPTGPLVPLGSEVTWTYQVTNPGNESIADVVVTDDQLVPGDQPLPVLADGFNTGDTNRSHLLDPGEVWLFSAIGVAAAGQYGNLGTATGRGTISAATLQAEDRDYYYGAVPAIALIKTGEFQDANGDGNADVGETITYRFTVTNTANLTLTNVTLADTVGGVTVNGGPIATLAVGAVDSTTFTGSYAITQADIDAGSFFNLATVTGTDPTGETVVDEDDDETHLPQQPAIDIEKATNGYDADMPTGPVVVAGSAVIWTYLVTNPGNVSLGNVLVRDDNGTPDNPADDFTPMFVGGDDNLNDRLDVGEAWRYQATGTARVGMYGNAGTATGIASSGHTVYDMDPSHYFAIAVKDEPGAAPLIVLAPDKSPGSPQAVRVVDSSTGQVLPEYGFVAYEDDYVGGTRIAIADLDGDGIDEIITAPGRNRAPEVRVFTLEGESVAGFPSFLAYSAASAGGVELTVADVNGDGKPDLITVPGYGVSDVRIFFNRFDALDLSKPAFRAAPDMSFQAFPVVTVGGAVVAAADMGSWDGNQFVNQTDGRAEIIVGTGVGGKATVAVFEVTGATRNPVRTFFPFTSHSTDFQGGVSLDVAWIDKDDDPQQDPPDVIVGMGVNGTSRIEVWAWDASDASLSLRGAIPEAFTGPSNNAPVRVAAWDSDGDGIAEAILAVQGPIGTTGEIQQFEITGTSPFLYQQAPPLAGFSGPWFIATSENATSGTNSPGPLPDQSIPAFDWTNTVNAYDVNKDGLATPLDVLETINYINTHPGETALPAEQFVPPRFFDCNADLVITAEDVLFVLNSFNRSSPYSGEGERSQPIGDAAGMSLPLDAGRGPVANPSGASIPEGERNETRDAADFALVAGGEWTAPEGQVPSPLVPYSSKPPIDDFRLFEWEAVLDDIAAEIAAS